jgi:Flp pilus assembly protein TadD
MKNHIIAAVAVAMLLVTIASALALVAGPFTREEALAASQDPRFYNELGYMLAQQEETAAAQDAFERAVEMDSQYVRARSNLATIAFQNADYTTAIEQLRWLTSESPDAGYSFDLAQNLVHQARFVDQDLTKLEEAAAIFESLGDYPNAAENARIVRNVLGTV